MCVFQHARPHQSALIDDAAAQKLQGVVTTQKVLVLVPFLMMALGFLLGLVFTALMCRHKRPEVRLLSRPPWAPVSGSI